MSRLVRSAESLRLDLLFFSVPYALMWSRGAGAAAPLIILAHALLVLLYAQSLDLAMLRAGQDPRLGPVRDRFRRAPAGLEAARLVVAILLVPTIGGLAILSTRLAFYAAAAAAIILLVTRGVSGRFAARRFVFAEWTWGFGALLIPAGLIATAKPSALSAPSGGLGMPAPVVAATCLGAVMLGVYILLCLVRDEAADRGAGFSSTPTLCGRAGALALLLAWMMGGVLLAAVGVTHGWWGWPVVTALAWAALASTWCTAVRADGLAVGLWIIGHAGVAVLLAAGILGGPPQPNTHPAPLAELIEEAAGEVRSHPLKPPASAE